MRRCYVTIYPPLPRQEATYAREMARKEGVADGSRKGKQIGTENGHLANYNSGVKRGKTPYQSGDPGPGPLRCHSQSRPVLVIVCHGRRFGWQMKVDDATCRAKYVCGDGRG